MRKKVSIERGKSRMEREEIRNGGEGKQKKRGEKKNKILSNDNLNLLLG